MFAHLRSRTLSAVILGLGLALAAPSPALAQFTTPTTFTYQGRFLQAGQPYTGTADVRVQLYRGVQPVGAPATISGVQVTGGLFTVPIDLGPELAAFNIFFATPPSYVPASVELSVRTPTGSGAFITLSPRQPLTPAPSALGLVNFSRTGTSEVNLSQLTDTQVFQISANVVQTVVPTRNGDVESVDLKLVNAGAPTPFTLTLRSNSTIFGTSTVTVPSGTSIVTFPFPVGTNITTTSVLRLDINTTTSLGVRYSLADPYLPGAANFLPGADLYFALRLRGDGSWLSPIPVAISSDDVTPLVVSSINTAGTAIRLEANSIDGRQWEFLATAFDSVDPEGLLRIRAIGSPAAAGLTLDATGRVGINKLTPTSPLHVGGNLAVDGNIILPVTTRQYNVPAANCSTLGSTGGVTVGAAGSVTGANAGQLVSLTAPINLPNGAVITKVRYSALDNATQDVTITLFSASMTSDTVSSIRTASTSGAVNAYVAATFDVTSATPIDNATRFYFIRATWTTPTTVANIALRSLGVEYTVTSPLP
jgi:hypothetical protein